VIVGVIGAMVGEVHNVRLHPQGTHIWLADVTLSSDTPPRQIVFGGDRRLTEGELVPVAPPGARVLDSRHDVGVRHKKVRARRYRGEWSHGMLCSLDELGWIRGGPNEVAVLRDLTPGQSLDNLPRRRRAKVVARWRRAKMTARAKKIRSFAVMVRLVLEPIDHWHPTTSSHQSWTYLAVH
jgi:tRNA-binding EMAP/Myf-like protein